MTAPSDLRSRTALSIGWTFLRIGGTNLLAFGVFAVLARFLSPDEFGVFALCMLSIGLAKGVAFLSLHEAVIQAAELDEATADSAFWACFGLGALAFLVIAALAPFYAAAVGEPQLAPTLQALGLVMPLIGLNLIHTGRALRDFGHKAIALRHLMGNLVGGAAGVAAAFQGLGLWALIIQQLVAEFAMMLAGWRSYPWRPRLRFAPSRLGSLLRFGGPLTLANSLNALGGQVEGTIVARALGVADLGSLRVGRRMTDLIAQLALQPFTAVSSVTLARLQTDHAAYRKALLRLMAVAATLAVPAMWGFGVIAGDLVVLLFGPQWATAGLAAQILSLMAVPVIVSAFAVPALLGRGRARATVRTSAVLLVFTTLTTLAAVPFGLTVLVCVLVARSHLTMTYYLFELRREIGLAPSAVFSALIRPVLAAAGMAATLLLAEPALRAMTGGNTLLFAACVVASGAAVYAAALLLVARRFVCEQLAAFRPMLRGRLGRPLAG